MQSSNCKLQSINLTKIYPGTTALNQVSVGFEGGKVHAVIGKNGAGKSTLVKIISGAIQPTTGKILIENRKVMLRSPRDAFLKGIAMVYQELSLIPELSVGENILFGRLPKRKSRIIDWQQVYTRARSILDSLHVNLDVKKKVNELGVAQQQIVEIAKAMSFNPSILILDEPTSALAHDEVETLFALIRNLAKRGVAIIYITHRLQELHEVADTVSVLRDANLIGTIGIKEATPEKIVTMMFGETVQQNRPVELTAGKEPVLAVKNLSQKNKLDNINFTLYQGEILGIAGMLGSGRTELLRAIMGVDKFDSGEIILHNRNIKRPRPALMKWFGVGFTPENRKEEGLVPIMSTRDNICLASLGRISFHGLIWKKRQRPVVEKTIRELQIAVADFDQPITSLSGGNQQKVVVGNWLNTKPSIMLFDEPTRGIDVQAKQQIFQIVWNLSAQGISSIFVSSELEELIEVCHRILVMQKGKIVAAVKPELVPLENLFKLCMGVPV